MLEFSSVSVSSYDAASLADRLTEKSADGWEVVAIVPAGTNVTAYLRREGDASASTHDGGHGTSEASPITAERVPEAAAAEAALAGAGTDHTNTVGQGASSATEPAGWGTEPATTSAASNDPAASTPWAPSGDSATDAVTTTAAGVDVAPAQDTSAQQPAQQPAEQPAAAQQPASAAPAGWYADPAQRYELRYWDGAQWTEHVSRAGQQYTDPPVA